MWLLCTHIFCELNFGCVDLVVAYQHPFHHHGLASCLFRSMPANLGQVDGNIWWMEPEASIVSVKCGVGS